MTATTTDFHPNRILTLVVGSTSAVALMSGATDANADGMYAGGSLGFASGEVPVVSDGDGDEYSLSGSVGGAFIGYDKTLSNGLMFGGEIAASGSTEGDPDENAGYDYSYDVNWNLDAKLRVGYAVMEKIKVYGFAGLTWGNANNYYRDYQYSGANYGLGAQYDINDDFFVGVEAIQRDINGYNDGTNGNEFGSKHQTINVRAGFQF